MSATIRALRRGMAFEIDDLVRIRTWAEREGLVLRIRLDHVERGQDLEEVLHLAPMGRGLWRVSLWREDQGIAMRQGSQPPVWFADVEAALGAAAAPRRRVGLRARFWPF